MAVAAFLVRNPMQSGQKIASDATDRSSTAAIRYAHQKFIQFFGLGWNFPRNFILLLFARPVVSPTAHYVVTCSAPCFAPPCFGLISFHNFTFETKGKPEIRSVASTMSSKPSISASSSKSSHDFEPIPINAQVAINAELIQGLVVSGILDRATFRTAFEPSGNANAVAAAICYGPFS